MTGNPTPTERPLRDPCAMAYCPEPAAIFTRRYGVSQWLCKRHADEPITCPKCGASSPCGNYGPGCP